MKANLGHLETDQAFAVVDNLSAPGILGCDFLKRKSTVIDFLKKYFQIPIATGPTEYWVSTKLVCVHFLDNDYSQAIPYPVTTLKPEFDFATDCHSLLKPVLKVPYFTSLVLGRTSVIQHIINTGN